MQAREVNIAIAKRITDDAWDQAIATAVIKRQKKAIHRWTFLSLIACIIIAVSTVMTINIPKVYTVGFYETAEIRISVINNTVFHNTDVENDDDDEIEKLVDTTFAMR